jgi:hypothetical protein
MDAHPDLQSDRPRCGPRLRSEETMVRWIASLPHTCYAKAEGWLLASSASILFGISAGLLPFWYFFCRLALLSLPRAFQREFCGKGGKKRCGRSRGGDRGQSPRYGFVLPRRRWTRIATPGMRNLIIRWCGEPFFRFHDNQPLIRRSWGRHTRYVPHSVREYL